MFGSKNKEEARPAHVREIFSYRDSKTGVFAPPTFAYNSVDLIRQLENFARMPDNKDHPLVLNPDDFSFFSLGTWDNSRGIMVTQEPQHVFSMFEIISSIKRQHGAPAQEGALLPT